MSNFEPTDTSNTTADTTSGGQSIEDRVAALEGRVRNVETQVAKVISSNAGGGDLEPGYDYGGARPPQPSPTPGIEPLPPTPSPEPLGNDVAMSDEEKQWTEAVQKVMSDYGFSEPDANTALKMLLSDHESRGRLWTASVREVMDRDGLDQATAERNLHNLLDTVYNNGQNQR